MKLTFTTKFVFISLTLIYFSIGQAQTTTAAQTTLKEVPNPIAVKKPGHSPAKNLKVKKSGVPQFDFFETKRVQGKSVKIRVSLMPRIDVGEEREISAENFSLQLPSAKSLQVKPIDKGFILKNVSIDAAKKRAHSPTAAVQTIKKVDGQWKIIPLIQLAQIREPEINQSEPQTIKVTYPPPGEIKFLQALIFMDLQKNYDLALGLLVDVQKELKELKTEVTYNLALMAQKLGLTSEFRSQMMKVLKDSSKDWQRKSILRLTEFAIEGDRDLAGILDPQIESLELELQRADLYQINRVKFYLEKGNLTLANDALEQLPEKSDYFGESQFLQSVFKYRAGQIKEAIETQKKALAWLIKHKPDTDLKSASALTLGRMLFQIGQYKEAFQTYLEVNKKYPEWPQAMIEQAWAQILAKDYEGAAGNMFTLHTDFFKNTFAPDSYVVRTVGYLNLCQFGDGAKVVQDLQRRYMPIMKQLLDYKNGHKNEMDHYNTVKSLFTNPQAKTIDGLSKYFVIELARHPSFTNEQSMINSFEDQLSSFDKTILGILEQEKQLSQKVVLTNARIAEVKKEPKKFPGGEAQRQERLLQIIRIQQVISKRSRVAIKELRDASIPRLEQEKSYYKKKASAALKNRFAGMMETLEKTLDHAELLKYELFSGAGEHLRYQMAGGGENEKARAELKPKDEKQMKWEFKGEVWEDELGHFRSSLKNVCPPEEN